MGLDVLLTYSYLSVSISIHTNSLLRLLTATVPDSTMINIVTYVRRAKSTTKSTTHFKETSSVEFCWNTLYYKLAGTRLILMTGVKTLGGRISFLPQSLPGKIIITYLIRVFDTKLIGGPNFGY